MISIVPQVVTTFDPDLGCLERNKALVGCTPHFLSHVRRGLLLLDRPILLCCSTIVVQTFVFLFFLSAYMYETCLQLCRRSSDSNVMNAPACLRGFIVRLQGFRNV